MLLTISCGSLCSLHKTVPALGSRQWSVNISWIESKTDKGENIKDVENPWYAQDYMNNQAFTIVWIHFI